MRDVRERVDKHRKPLPIAVMVGHPWHYRGTAWTRSTATSAACCSTWPPGRTKASWTPPSPPATTAPAATPTKAYQALAEETDGKVDLWYYAWVPQTPEEFDRDFTAANQLGAKRILFWEADYIDDRPNAAALKQAMSARATVIAATGFSHRPVQFRPPRADT